MCNWPCHLSAARGSVRFTDGWERVLNNDVSWPGWADAELSAGLRRIIDGGEGQGVEFKAIIGRHLKPGS